MGQIISLLGDWFNLIASAALVAQLTKSGLAVGVLFVVRMLSPFFTSLFAGLLADKYNRRNILLVADILRAFAAFGFLLVRDPADVWLVFVFTALQLGISGIFNPTYNAILPDLTTENELGAANALSSATWAVMLAVGAALGGLVSGYFGMYTAFAIDGLTFLVSAGFLAAITYRPPERTGPAEGGSLFAQYRQGLAYLKNNRSILVLATNKAWVTLTTWAGIQVSLVTLSQNVFPIGDGGSISLGLMFAAQGLGTGLGPIFLRRITRDDPDRMRTMIAASFAMSTVGLVTAAVLGQLWIFLLGLILVGLGAGSVWVFTTQLLLIQVPADIRGRIMAVELGLFTLASAAAAAIVGAATELGSTERHILLTSAVVAIVPAVLWTVRVAKKIDRAV
jgi:MFS family permease